MNINQVWPEWNEDCVLGEGSFGKVFRAKRVEFGRTFYSAIKVLSVPKNQQEIRFARSQGMNDAEIYSYFQSLVGNLLNEITLMDNLKGAKNIVGIEDYKIIERQGEIGWDIFIRMELLSPFDNFVSNPNFSQCDVLKLGVDICTALENCEQNNIVHRDIKPDNIFVSRFGEYKLGDFGIARRLETSQANLSKKGTLNYMAPEIYKSEEYGPNVDIYSLGLVLYTLLNNNRVPFLPPYPQPITYKDNEEALYHRLSGSIMAPPCNANHSLGAVILKACAYNPYERYRTATEFKNALINEWTLIQQSGFNPPIGIQGSTASVSSVQKERTTNDMTANGRIVMDEYSRPATDFGSSEDFNNLNNYSQNVDNSIYSGNGSMGMPGVYGKSKFSKLAHIAAIPLSAAAIVFALICTGRFQGMAMGILSCVSVIMTAAAVLLGGSNKKAVGMGTVSLSLPLILPSGAELFTRLQEGFPVDAVITLVAGLFLLFSGIVLLTQKEAKFGGSLCFYGTLIQLVYDIYLIAVTKASPDFSHLILLPLALSVFMWASGYDREADISGIKKVLHLIAYIPGAIALVTAVILSAGFIRS